MAAGLAAFKTRQNRRDKTAHVFHADFHLEDTCDPCRFDLIASMQLQCISAASSARPCNQYSLQSVDLPKRVGRFVGIRSTMMWSIFVISLTVELKQWSPIHSASNLVTLSSKLAATVSQRITRSRLLSRIWKSNPDRCFSSSPASNRPVWCCCDVALLMAGTVGVLVVSSLMRLQPPSLPQHWSHAQLRGALWSPIFRRWIFGRSLRQLIYLLRVLAIQRRARWFVQRAVTVLFLWAWIL